MNLLKRFILVLSSSILLVNCPTGPPFDENLNEAVATLPAPEFDNHLFWASNGQIIFVGDEGFFQIDSRMGNVTEFVSRDELPRSALFSGVRIEAAYLVEVDDKLKLYFLADEREAGPDQGIGGLYEVDVANNSISQILSDVTDFEISHDGSAIAFTRPDQESLDDSLFIYEVATREQRFLTIGLPLAFSPEDDSLFVDGPEENFQLSVVDRASKNEQPLTFESDVLFRQSELAIQWDFQLPDFVYADNRERRARPVGFLKRWDGSMQESQNLWQPPEGESFGLALPLAWSDERRHIAKWTDRCFEGG